MTEGAGKAGAAASEFSIETFDGYEPPQSRGPTSIGALRRGQLKRQFPSGPGADNPLDEGIRRDLDQLKAAVEEMRHVGRDSRLAEDIARMDKRLAAIGDSTAFTEAYVAVEMREKLSETIDAGFGSLRAEFSRQRRDRTRLWLMTALVALTFTLLAAEMLGDRVSQTLAAIPAMSEWARMPF